MEELVTLVESKTGLSHDQAMAATKAVIDYLKSKLPAPVASQIDGVLTGGAGLADKAKTVGDMFRKT